MLRKIYMIGNIGRVRFIFKFTVNINNARDSVGYST
nr:MAG TPA: hypothetical protein [Caudoviricetes sp.]